MLCYTQNTLLGEPPLPSRTKVHTTNRKVLSRDDFSHPRSTQGSRRASRPGRASKAIISQG